MTAKVKGAAQPEKAAAVPEVESTSVPPVLDLAPDAVVPENAATLEASLAAAPEVASEVQPEAPTAEVEPAFVGPDGDLLGEVSQDRPVYAQTYDPAQPSSKGIDDVADGYQIPVRVVLSQDREVIQGDSRFEGGGDPYPMFGDPTRETKLQPVRKE
jgi:hypothetical protein